MVRAYPPANHPTLARRGLLLVLSAPSGTGKTSIARAVLERDPHITMAKTIILCRFPTIS